MKRENMGNLVILTFPRFWGKKSLIKLSQLFFSTRNKGKIKIQNKPPFLELFDVTCFRNIVKKYKNSHRNTNGSDGERPQSRFAGRMISVSTETRTGKNNNNKKL